MQGTGCGNPVDEGTTRRATDIPMYRLEKPADSTHSSKCGLSSREHPGLIPGAGRFPGEGNGYPLQYSYMKNYMDKGVWWATVHGITKSQT